MFAELNQLFEAPSPRTQEFVISQIANPKNDIQMFIFFLSALVHRKNGKFREARAEIQKILVQFPRDISTEDRMFLQHVLASMQTLAAAASTQ